MVSMHMPKKQLATALSLAVAASILSNVIVTVTTIAYAQTTPPSSSCDNVSQPFQADPKTYTLNIDGKNYKILYNGFITSISPHSENASLNIALQDVTSDCLVMQLPRQVVDASNKDFEVYVDGKESNFKESSVPSNESRTLLIPLQDNTKTVTITGTYVIPEFGTVTALILIGAVASVIGLNRAYIFKFIWR